MLDTCFSPLCLHLLFFTVPLIIKEGGRNEANYKGREREINQSDTHCLIDFLIYFFVAVQFDSCECARRATKNASHGFLCFRVKETTNILGIYPEKNRKNRKRLGPKGATLSQNSCDKIRLFCKAWRLI